MHARWFARRRVREAPEGQDLPSKLPRRPRPAPLSSPAGAPGPSQGASRQDAGARPLGAGLRPATAPSVRCGGWLWLVRMRLRAPRVPTAVLAPRGAGRRAWHGGVRSPLGDHGGEGRAGSSPLRRPPFAVVRPCGLFVPGLCSGDPGNWPRGHLAVRGSGRGLRGAAGLTGPASRAPAGRPVSLRSDSICLCGFEQLSGPVSLSRGHVGACCAGQVGAGCWCQVVFVGLDVGARV